MHDSDVCREPLVNPVAENGHLPVDNPIAVTSGTSNLSKLITAVRSDSLLKVVMPGFVLLGLSIAWEQWASTANSVMIPQPAETYAALFELVTHGELWTATGSSSTAAMLGFGIAILLGVPIGITMGTRRWWERFLDVYMNLLLVVPLAAVMPILIMITGIGLTTRVVIVVLFTVPFVVINTRAGVKSIDITLVQMARSFGGSRRQIWLRILAPGAAGGIVVGMSLGLTRAIRGVFVAELLLVPAGLGGLVLKYQARFEAANFYATIVFVILLSLAVSGAMRFFQRLIMPWCQSVDATRSAMGTAKR